MQTVKEIDAVTGGAGRLRDLFAQPGVVRIVGAHNPLGARLAERAGFDGVWSSGLEISASHGMPDTDLLTMSELLSVAGAMAAAVDVPVIADCDAGYGNAHNVMHMIRRYERAGISAVSIEDKIFPKVNSFIPGRQELASVSEFCGKIEAAKSAQQGSDLMVIARIEALIAGHGMAEALRRGEAYAEAGADAVLIHAKGDSPEPVLEFLRAWRPDMPVVVVPTTYHRISAEELGAAGAKLVIYANHGLRAGISAVTEVFDAILRDGRSTGIEDRIAPLAEVFDLQGMSRLKEDEKRFVRREGAPARAVVLPGTPDGSPVAEAGSASAAEVRKNALMAGGLAPVADLSSGRTADLQDVPAEFSGKTVVTEADVLADPEPLTWLASSPADIAMLVELSPASEQGPTSGVSVTLTAPSIAGLRGVGGLIVRALGDEADEARAAFTGIAAFSPKGFAALQEVAAKRQTFQDGDVGLADLLADLLATGWSVRATGITGGWARTRRPEALQTSAVEAERGTE